MADKMLLKGHLARSETRCKELCQAVGVCNAFVYDRAEDECNIMSVHSSDSIKEAPGKVFGLNYCSGR